MIDLEKYPKSRGCEFRWNCITEGATLKEKPSKNGQFLDLLWFRESDKSWIYVSSKINENNS